jgi:tRNA(adenine34) deaminase
MARPRTRVSRNRRNFLAAVLGTFAVAFVAWRMPPRGGLHAPTPEAISPAQAERDEIFMLLAYALVLEHWDPGTENRGHNVGALLVDDRGQPVAFDLNHNLRYRSGAEHAEARVLQHHLRRVGTFKLEDYTVYATLEPCAMCAGMVAMLDVSRVVYGQSDPAYGKAFERLALDSHELHGGYAPYARTVVSVPSESSIRKELDAAYTAQLRQDRMSLANWLRKPAVHAIYEKARERLSSLKPKYSENEKVLQSARSFYETFSLDAPDAAEPAAAAPDQAR